MNLKPLVKLALAGSVFMGLSAFGQDKENSSASNTKTDRFLILGNKYQEGFKMPGSGTTISLDQIRTHSHSDVNRILGRVPGVFIREEDGYGLFPNISIRGVNVYQFYDFLGAQMTKNSLSPQTVYFLYSKFIVSTSNGQTICLQHLNG